MIGVTVSVAEMENKRLSLDLNVFVFSLQIISNVKIYI